MQTVKAMAVSERFFYCVLFALVFCSLLFQSSQ